MKLYKWDEARANSGNFWDSTTDSAIPIFTNKSDKEMINNPGGYELRFAIEALCRIVAELVEIEENRSE